MPVTTKSLRKAMLDGLLEEIVETKERAERADELETILSAVLDELTAIANEYPDPCPTCGNAEPICWDFDEIRLADRSTVSARHSHRRSVTLDRDSVVELCGKLRRALDDN